MEKKIGFICPLGEEDSETRKRSDYIEKNIITPVAKELKFAVKRADKINGVVIMDDIITLLKEADIIIADLTDMNPNVFYELGIRQAIKGKCIYIIQKSDDNKDGLPFNLGFSRAHKYVLDGTSGDIKEFKNYIKNSILEIKDSKWNPCVYLSPEHLSKAYDATVVLDFLKGGKSHYSLAKNLFTIPCRNIFLMQRSNSLVLNAERGEDWEAEFITNLKKAIKICGNFYHVISIKGIQSHLERNSEFSKFKEFSEYFENIDGKAAIRIVKDTDKIDNEPDKVFFLKKLPAEKQDTRFKLDRQARVLITEDTEDQVKAIIVQNLGEEQTCFLIQGTKAKEYLEACINYCKDLEKVEWQEIEKLYKNYERIQKNRLK